MNELLNILGGQGAPILTNRLAQMMQPRPQPSPYGVAPPVMSGSYLTKLDPLQELAFQKWVADNKIPFDPSPTADYDMRGFYRAQLNGDKSASSGINANDGRMHFTDKFKTPYHESFSAESKFAAPGAPSWNQLDQLVTPSGKVVFDERKRNKK